MPFELKPVEKLEIHTPLDNFIEPTSLALKALGPAHVIPTHCTGRQAVMHLEREMPDQLLLNMSGTKLTFSASA